MTRKRQNSENQGDPESSSKKQTNVKQYFDTRIFDENFQDELASSIAGSSPYKWGTITQLLNDSLLRDVRKEVETEIHFTKKETDIYKVYQSGDLANLSGLNWDDLSRLPSLFKLREALYSSEFRDLISCVTKCGKLSGVKTDMSINTYTKGCHLLTHDDVIGSRRVSFILYLPDPDKIWKDHYGGALRLFPAVVPNVPEVDYSKKLVPQFNQLAFFTVQPGLSFHDVEEVRVDKQRLSIQGWYHIPQRGEDGFIEGEEAETEARSTLQQLESKELEEFDFPKEVRVPFSAFEIANYENITGLTESDLEYLQKYLNPDLLQLDEIEKLQKRFIDENFIEVDEFLREEVASKLRKLIRRAELDEDMPNTAKEVEFPWKVSRPPHKWRYLYMDGKQPEESTVEGVRISNQGPQESPNFTLLKHTTHHVASLQLIDVASFLKSVSFKKWLTLLTDLIPVSDQILVRRFRQGHDFKLATSINTDNDIDAILEATLALTPSTGWESGEFGGYELSMTTDSNDGDDEDDDDPAIYKASKDGDDSVLLNTQASWNKLSLMIRDPSVLKFVKYVSYNAKGSRWDIAAQWDIKQKDDDDEDDDDEQEEQEKE
jgi:Rps23 Pro-64 3,4-dihydroxylase Tpa1-like proline 4-hydroxylase